MIDLPAPFTPHDFAVIEHTVTIERSRAAAWKAIGNYGDAGRFLDIDCRILSGHDGIGSLRQVGEIILEVMVSKTQYSYAYAQTQGPMAPYGYHGCVSLAADGEQSCTLTYTLTYDQASMTPEQRSAQFERITQRFHGAAIAMKAAAEMR